MILLDKSLNFPPVHLALEDGLLAYGGDLSSERLLLAYQKGIFPWFDEDDFAPLWWSPDPRFVLFPDKIKISKSMKPMLNRDDIEFKINHDFEQVIHHCKVTNRTNQLGTWITTDMEKAYIKLHEKGIAHSAECWHRNKLVGGLYGIKLKHVFCGESMFSLMPNASKRAFIQYVAQLKQDNIQLIDCQIYTAHLESLGAEMIPRSTYLNYLVD